MDIIYEIAKHCALETVIALTTTCSTANSNQLWLFLHTRDYQNQLHTHYNSCYKQLYKLCFQLTKIEKYHLGHCSLSEIINKTDFSLSVRHFLTLPMYVCQLVNLQTLNIGINSLTDLPDDFTKLINLRLLYLGANNLSQLPVPLYKLTNLRRLRLSHNYITHLSHDITNLVNLRGL